MNIALLKASSVLGVIDRREIVQTIRALFSDPDDEELMSVALCDEDDNDCIDGALERLYKSRDLDSMSIEHSLSIYAKSICKKIIDGALSPTVGCEMISKVAIRSGPSGYVQLDPFIYVASEVESRPEDKAFFEDVIFKEAKNLTQQHHGANDGA